MLFNYSVILSKLISLNFLKVKSDHITFGKKYIVIKVIIIVKFKKVKYYQTNTVLFGIQPFCLIFIVKIANFTFFEDTHLYGNYLLLL